MDNVIYPCVECNERHSCIFFLEDSEECVYDTELRIAEQRKVLDKLNSFRELNKPNWDGRNALPIPAHTIDSLINIIPRLKSKTMVQVFPLVSGGVQLEFEPDEDNYLELEYLVFAYESRPYDLLVDIIAYEAHKTSSKEYSVALDVDYNDKTTIVDTINDAIKSFESKKV